MHFLSMETNKQANKQTNKETIKHIDRKRAHRWTNRYSVFLTNNIRKSIKQTKGRPSLQEQNKNRQILRWLDRNIEKQKQKQK